MSSNNSWLKQDNLKLYADTYFNSKFSLDTYGVAELANYIINPGIVSSIFQNPSDWVSSLTLYPFKVSYTEADISGFLQIASFETNIPCKLVSSNFAWFNMGEVYIPRYFNNFADFNGYTKIDAWLPYYGFVQIEPNDVLGKYLEIALSVDYGSGQAIYYLGVSDTTISPHATYPKWAADLFASTRILSTHSFQLGYPIPLGSTNTAEVYRNMLMGAVKAGSAAIGAYTVGAAGAAAATTTTTSVTNSVRKNKKKEVIGTTDTKVTRNSLTDTSQYLKGNAISEVFNYSSDSLANMHIGAHSDVANNPNIVCNGSSSVKIIIYRPKIKSINADYLHLYGVPLGEMKQLSELYGYTKIGDIHLEDDGFGRATQTELAMIADTLLKGVILKDATPMLSAPVISISGTTLSISGPSGVSPTYTIYVNGQAKTSTSSATYDLGQLGLDVGVYSVSVVASASGYKKSPISNSVTYTVASEATLPAPVLSINGNMLTITDASRTANNAVVYINSKTYNTYTYNQQGFVQVDLSSLSAGSYSIYAISKASGYKTSARSNTVTYNKAQEEELPKPLVSIYNDTLTITDTSDNADRFTIFVNGRGKVTIDSVDGSASYDLNNLGLSAGTYTITVTAKADGYEDSPLSDYVTYVVLPTMVPPTVSISGSLLTITDNSGGQAYGFTVYVDGSVQTTVAYDATVGYGEVEMSDWGLADGTYSVNATASGNGYKTSGFSNTVIYEVLDYEAKLVGTWTLNPSNFDTSMITTQYSSTEWRIIGYYPWNGNVNDIGLKEYRYFTITDGVGVAFLTRTVNPDGIVFMSEYPIIIDAITEEIYSDSQNNRWLDFSTFTIDSVPDTNVSDLEMVLAFLQANATKH